MVEDHASNILRWGVEQESSQAILAHLGRFKQKPLAVVARWLSETLPGMRRGASRWQKSRESLTEIQPKKHGQERFAGEGKSCAKGRFP